MSLSRIRSLFTPMLQVPWGSGVRGLCGDSLDTPGRCCGELRDEPPWAACHHHCPGTGSQEKGNHCRSKEVNVMIWILKQGCRTVRKVLLGESPSPASFSAVENVNSARSFVHLCVAAMFLLQMWLVRRRKDRVLLLFK